MSKRQQHNDAIFSRGNLLLFEQQQSLNPFEVKAAVMLKKHFKNDSIFEH